MSTRPSDRPRVESCTSTAGCPVHPGVTGIHPPWGLANPGEMFDELSMINGALERAMPESWDGEDSWVSIAAAWIEHMATTHGAHCAGPHCEATADTPAYVGALRRMWHETETTDHPEWCVDKRETLSDLAHELGVDLDADA